MQKILIISDYDPDINNKKRMANGVARVLFSIKNELDKNYKIEVLHPFIKRNGQDVFKRVSIAKIYPGFEIALTTPKKIANLILEFKPEYILIITPEGPMGLLGKSACSLINKKKLTLGKIEPTVVYTTNLEAYSQKYINKFTKGIVRFNPAFVRKSLASLYKNTHKVLVHTRKSEEYLNSNNIKNTVIWPAGVDASLFHLATSEDKNPYNMYDWYKSDPKPIYLYAGRVAPEKNIDSFLSITAPDVYKVVIGDGPDTKRLCAKYSDDNSVRFIASLRGEEYALHLRFADLFIFPSMTDTWGQVITEAGASGVPVVVYDVAGSGEVIENGKNGIKVSLDGDLKNGIKEALKINRKECSNYVCRKYSWVKSAQILVKNLKKIDWM